MEAMRIGVKDGSELVRVLFLVLTKDFSYGDRYICIDKPVELDVL